MFQVGCGLENVNLIRDALYTQTKHVQFVVFERADKVIFGFVTLFESTFVLPNIFSQA